MRPRILLALAFALLLAGRPAVAAPIHVVLGTSLGDVTLELYPDAAPLTVQNFLAYADQYVSSFVHRSVPGVILQGGTYRYASGSFGEVNTLPAVQNEFQLPNLAGTIAMAKFANQPDSATSGWFINLADNGGLPNEFDTKNGGYTVFGKIIDGMPVIEAIAALSRFNGGTDLESLPLRDFTPPGGPQTDWSQHLVLITSFTVVPEPGTGLLVLGGLTALSAVRRIRGR